MNLSPSSPPGEEQRYNLGSGGRSTLVESNKKILAGNLVLAPVQVGCIYYYSIVFNCELWLKATKRSSCWKCSLGFKLPVQYSIVFNWVQTILYFSMGELWLKATKRSSCSKFSLLQSAHSCQICRLLIDKGIDSDIYIFEINSDKYQFWK